MRLDGCIHASGDDQTVRRCQFVRFLIFRFGLREIAARGVHVTQREMRHIEMGVCGCKTLEVFLGVAIVAEFA